MCTKIHHKKLNSVVVGARKLPGFSEIIALCLNLDIGYYITWLVLSNYKKISL